MSAKSKSSFSACYISRTLAMLLTVLLVFPDTPALAQSNCVSTKWTQFNANLQNRTETFNAVVKNGYLYAIGGVTDPTSQGAGTFRKTVQYAQLDSTTGLATNLKTPGIMNLASAQLTTAIARDLCGVAYNGYVYVVGGVKPGGTWGATTGDVSRGKISNGDITGWTTQTGVMSASHPVVQLHGTVIVPEGSTAFIYIIGGSYGTDASPTQTTAAAHITNNVYKAQINADHTVTSFTNTNVAALPIRLYKTCPVVVNGTIYVAGGESPDSTNPNGPAVDTVYYATPDSNGEITQWLTANSLPYNSSANPPTTTMASQAVVYVNTKGILMMGGDARGNGNDNSALLEGESPVGGNINWSIWTSTPPPSPLALPANLSRNAGATFNHYAYSLGGLVTGTDSNVINCFLVP